MALVSFVSAQTLDRDLRSDVFRAFGAGSEIGVSVRELSNDEISKPGPRGRVACTSRASARAAPRHGPTSAVATSSSESTASVCDAVRTPQDVTAAARRTAPGTVLDFRVLRDRKETTLRVTVPEAQSPGSRQIPI